MGAFIGMVLLGGFLFLFILYNIIMSAVEEGTLKALMKYEKIKNKENEGE